MGLRTTASYDLWTLDAANEYTTFILSGDFRNAIFTVIADNSASCTIKFYGSWMEDRPTFASVASITNEYSTVQVVNLENWTGIDGDTWIVLAWSSDWITRYEINENGNNWLWIKMTARAAWDVTLKVDLYDNQ